MSRTIDEIYYSELGIGHTEAEQALLGCLMGDPSVLDTTLANLRASEFYHDHHQLLYSEISRLIRSGVGICYVTLQEALRCGGTWEQIGGRETITACMDKGVFSHFLPMYVDIVRKYAKRRNLALLLQRASAAVEDYSRDINEISSRLQTRLAETDTFDIGTTAKHIGEIALEALEAIDRQQAGEILTFPTGLRDLDMCIGGLEPGRMTVVAGRPGSGKTSLALTMIEHVARMDGVGCLLQSLEMRNVEQAKRLLSAIAKVNSKKFRPNVGMTRDEYDSVRRACDSLQKLPFWIDDASKRTPAQILAQARLFKRRHNVQILAVDHGGLVQPGEHSQRKEARFQIAETSRELKSLAKDEDFAVVCLFQLNRDIERRENKRPRMSDLRECGAIEEDADIVLLANRPHEYDKTANEHLVEVHVAKNRDGETGVIPLAFYREITKFEDWRPELGPTDIPVDAYNE